MAIDHIISSNTSTNDTDESTLPNDIHQSKRNTIKTFNVLKMTKIATEHETHNSSFKTGWDYILRLHTLFLFLTFPVGV